MKPHLQEITLAEPGLTLRFWEVTYCVPSPCLWG